MADQAGHSNVSDTQEKQIVRLLAQLATKDAEIAAKNTIIAEIQRNYDTEKQARIHQTASTATPSSTPPTTPQTTALTHALDTAVQLQRRALDDHIKVIRSIPEGELVEIKPFKTFIEKELVYHLDQLLADVAHQVEHYKKLAGFERARARKFRQERDAANTQITKFHEAHAVLESRALPDETAIALADLRVTIEYATQELLNISKDILVDTNISDDIDVVSPRKGDQSLTTRINYQNLDVLVTGFRAAITALRKAATDATSTPNQPQDASPNGAEIARLTMNFESMKNRAENAERDVQPIAEHVLNAESRCDISVLQIAELQKKITELTSRSQQNSSAIGDLIDENEKLKHILNDVGIVYEASNSTITGISAITNEDAKKIALLVRKIKASNQTLRKALFDLGDKLSKTTDATPKDNTARINELEREITHLNYEINTLKANATAWGTDKTKLVEQKKYLNKEIADLKTHINHLRLNPQGTESNSTVKQLRAEIVRLKINNKDSEDELQQVANENDQFEEENARLTRGTEVPYLKSNIKGLEMELKNIKVSAQLDTDTAEAALEKCLSDKQGEKDGRAVENAFAKHRITELEAQLAAANALAEERLTALQNPPSSSGPSPEVLATPELAQVDEAFASSKTTNKGSQELIDTLITRVEELQTEIDRLNTVLTEPVGAEHTALEAEQALQLIQLQADLDSIRDRKHALQDQVNDLNQQLANRPTNEEITALTEQRDGIQGLLNDQSSNETTIAVMKKLLDRHCTDKPNCGKEIKQIVKLTAEIKAAQNALAEAQVAGGDAVRHNQINNDTNAQLRVTIATLEGRIEALIADVNRLTAELHYYVEGESPKMAQARLKARTAARAKATKAKNAAAKTAKADADTATGAATNKKADQKNKEKAKTEMKTKTKTKGEGTQTKTATTGTATETKDEGKGKAKDPKDTAEGSKKGKGGSKKKKGKGKKKVKEKGPATEYRESSDEEEPNDEPEDTDEDLNAEEYMGDTGSEDGGGVGGKPGSSSTVTTRKRRLPDISEEDEYETEDDDLDDLSRPQPTLSPTPQEKRAVAKKKAAAEMKRKAAAVLGEQSDDEGDRDAPPKKRRGRRGRPKN